MSDERTCPECGRRLHGVATARGGRLRCPACSGERGGPADAVTTEAGACSSCPKCGAALPPGAVLCVDCGYAFRTGERLKTKHRRARRAWDMSRPLVKRVVAVVAVTFGVVFVCVCFEADAGPLLWLLLLIVPVFVAFLLTPLRPRSRIILERDHRGRFRLAKRQWFCMMPLGGWTIHLDERDRAFIDYTPSRDRYGNETNGWYTLGVARDRGDAPYVVYYGRNEGLMHDIADALRDMAGVRLERR